jgi:hypothetical protein
MKKILWVTLLLVLTFALITCDNGNDESTVTVGGKTVAKQSGVTNAEFNTAVANLNTAFNYLDDTEKGHWNTRVTAIQIVSGSTVTHEGTVLKVGSGASETAITNYLALTLLAQLQPSRHIRLATQSIRHINVSA